MCDKQSYRSEQHALKIIFRRLMSAINPPSQLRPYFCQPCQAWHITSKDYNPR